MNTPESVLNDLLALGDTVEAVYTKLKHLGIKGKCVNPWHCVITEYLIHKGHHALVTTHSRVKIGDGDLDSQNNFEIKTPLLISMFMSRFDAKDYPDLIAD